jgi:hypothetical protein
MTTKTKKATNDTAVDAGMVGTFVLRAVVEPGYQYLNGARNGFTLVLADAAEFKTDTDAAEAAGEFNEKFPGHARTLMVCRVEDVTGALMHIMSVFVGASAPELVPTVQGELLPSDAGVAAPAPVTGTLVLSSPGGALMTATALKAHAADLKKLAKGARDLSQHKEALTFEQNATMIEETLLVQLEPQAKLPFGYADVKKALGDRISGRLRSQLVTAIKRDTPIIEGDTSGKERAAKIEQKIDDFEALVGTVASIVTALVEPVISQAAEKGMLAGRMARETTADVLALEALETVNDA